MQTFPDNCVSTHIGKHSGLLLAVRINVYIERRSGLVVEAVSCRFCLGTSRTACMPTSGRTEVTSTWPFELVFCYADLAEIAALTLCFMVSCSASNTCCFSANLAQHRQLHSRTQKYKIPDAVTLIVTSSMKELSCLYKLHSIFR